MTTPKTILITGANRGIGLEFVKEYCTQPNTHILATCRDPEHATALNTLAQKNKNIKIFQLDVTRESELKNLVKTITSDLKLNIDILINNAGVIGDRAEKIGHFNTEDFKQVYLTNTIAPLKVAELFLPLIKKSHLKTVVAISSSMGSLAENTSGAYYSYRASKAALNMVMKNLSLEEPDLCCLLLHPGWVKTDMGGAHATTTVEDSVKGLLTVIDKHAGKTKRIQFLDYQGKTVPW